MAIDSDLLVVGGGIGGLTTAITAAREGVDVRLLSYKQSTLRNASGLVDVLGYTPDGEGPLTDPFEAIPDLPEEHPYRTVGVEGVRAAMDVFDDVTAYRGDHTDTNALLPTHGGTVKPTARYPPSVAAGLASDERDVLLVGLQSMTDFDAPHVAAHLESAGVPFDVNGVTIQFPGDLQADAKVTRYAKLLENDEDVRAGLVERIERNRSGEARIGLPAILGDEDHAHVRTHLESELGVPVFEVPSGPPSLPGLRLEDALFSALEAAGGRYETGNPVVDYDGDGHVEQIYVEKNGSKIPYGADQYVLATGGLVGKGIESDREGVYEPIFDCYVDHAEDRYEWFDGDVFGDHPFARYGVDTDEELRVLDAGGDPQFDNLRAAGGVLGGYDYAAEKSGSGVSIATGYHAATAATEEL